MYRESKNPQWLIGVRRGFCLLYAGICLMLAWAEIYAQEIPLSAGRQVAYPQKKSRAEHGLSRDEIYQAEEQLAALGYWTGALDGKFDADSRHALVAFQKLQGRTPTGLLTRVECATLLVAKPPQARQPGYAHIEVDLARQVVFMVEAEGKVSHILPISSGSGKEFTSEGWTRRAVTPTGRFEICRKIRGWRKSPLGLLYYPNYICGGIAIHGNPSVPAVPASHGCIRIPMFAAESFSRLTPVGTIVLVYDESLPNLTP
jgi:hypothetical protein